jgi:acrylyl-CoA reductase (NADPH)
MAEERFPALVLEEKEGKVVSELREIGLEDLPEGDTLVAVSHSSLNYKDGMILKGLGRLVRRYPHVGGIDFAGTVISCQSGLFQPGERVILTGWRVGETHWGGYAARARVKGEWLVRLPEGMTPEWAMAIGTAGLTAMLALMALERQGLEPAAGDLLVTGAAGGVGSVAVMLGARLGYRVVASTGRPSEEAYLKGLGAAEILPRQALLDAAAEKKPLLGERFAGAVDTVGGQVLAGLLPQLRYGGAVAACGLAGGAELHTTVIPFLLRGVSLLGIDSVMQHRPVREAAWRRLAELLPPERLAPVISRAKLADLPRLAEEILAGRIRGRVVVEVGG